LGKSNKVDDVVRRRKELLTTMTREIVGLEQRNNLYQVVANFFEE
jgi:hypothetical protein